MGQQYNLAIQHYEQLKKIFLSKISVHLENSVAQIMLGTGSNNQNSIDGIFAQAVGYKDTGNMNTEQINQVLNNIFNQFSQILNENFNTTQFVEYSQQQIKEQWKFIDEKLDTTQKELALKMQQYIQHLGKSALKQFMIQAIQMQGNSIQDSTINTETRFQALIDRVGTLGRIWAESTILNGTQSYQLYAGSSLLRQLGGYIREDLAFQGLQNFFNSNSLSKAINVQPGGAKTVNGQMIEMDNIIGFLDWTEQNFNKQINEQGIYSIISPEDKTRILNEIQFFGEQVKSFTITKIKAGYAGAHIGNREELKESAIKQYNTPYLTLLQNAEFMGQYGSILKTLGPYNVFWTTAGGRQFTSDFIRDFHKQKLKLMFGYAELVEDSRNKKEKLDRKYPITNEIVLDRYTDKTGKKRIGVYKKIRWH